MTTPATARAERWRATPAAYLTTGQADTGPAPTATRRRPTRTPIPDDTAARHDRWRATLAAHTATSKTAPNTPTGSGARPDAGHPHGGARAGRDPPR